MKYGQFGKQPIKSIKCWQATNIGLLVRISLKLYYIIIQLNYLFQIY